MEEQDQNDTQTTDQATTAPPVSGGQVMDVTVPSKPLDTSDLSPGTSAVEEGASTQELSGSNTMPSSAVVDPPAEVSESTEFAPEDGSITSPPSESPAPEVTPEVSAPVEPTPPVDSPLPDNDVMGAAPDPESPAPLTDDMSSPDAQQESGPAQHLPPKGGGAPVLAIIIAVVVGLALAGLVVFTYFNNKNSDKTADSGSGSQTVVSKSQANTSDVDATNEAIDNGLQQTDENKDFPATELSDTSLGL